MDGNRQGHPMISRSSKLLLALGVLCALTASAQQEQKKAVPAGSAARFANLKTAYVTRTGGNPIAYDVISSSIDGWGRFAPVSSPEKADIIIEISSTDPGGVVKSNGTKYGQKDGRPEPYSSATKDFSLPEVRMVAYLAGDKNKVPIWSGIEHAKAAFKEKARENNLVEAAQRLFAKFHDTVEPPQR
jgi:hypothetical protein